MFPTALLKQVPCSGDHNMAFKSSRAIRLSHALGIWDSIGYPIIHGGPPQSPDPTFKFQAKAESTGIYLVLWFGKKPL